MLGVYASRFLHFPPQRLHGPNSSVKVDEMGTAKATALGAALFGSIIIGAWVGPYFADRAQAFGEGDVFLTSRPAQAPVPLTPKAPEPEAHADRAHGAAVPSAAVQTTKIPLDDAKLVKRLKPMLTGGADMEVVSSGFRNSEDLAAAVHAAKNMKVPFMILKHEMVDEGRTLVAAIHVVKPTANASLEADLARSEARADLALIK